MEEKRFASLPEVVAVASYLAKAYATTGIKDIRLNGPKTALIIELNDGTMPEISAQDLMFTAIYDVGHTGKVDLAKNSELFDSHAPDYFAPQADVDSLWDILVDDISGGTHNFLSLVDVYLANHKLVTSEAVDYEINTLNAKVTSIENDTNHNNVAISDLIRGAYFDVQNTEELELKKSDSGVILDGTGLMVFEKQINKDQAGGYLGINGQGKVHTGFIPVATDISAGIAMAGQGISVSNFGVFSVEPPNLLYSNPKLPTVNNVQAALDTLVQGIKEFISLETIGYSEPSDAFVPAAFATYCTNFPFGAKLVSYSATDDARYPKLAAFLSGAVGAGLIDQESVAVTIENRSVALDKGVIKYTIANGSQTEAEALSEEYTYIASNDYVSTWEKTYGDIYGVCYYSDAQKAELLNFATEKDWGRIIVGVSDGNVYKLSRRTQPDETTSYFWEQLTISLPTNMTYLQGGANITIDQSASYVIFGDVTNLTISVLTPVEIIVLGAITNLTLPNTIETVRLTSTGYVGVDLERDDVVSLASGSIIGKYQVRCIALQ